MKTLLLLMTLALASSCSKSFPKAVSTYFSKEVCSCLFVVKQSEEYCLSYHEQFLTPASHSIDYDKKVVSSERFFLSTSARFIDEKSGCQVF
jgi:hypothetical protein